MRSGPGRFAFLALLLLLLAFPQAVRGDEEAKPEEHAAPLTPEQAAERVLVLVAA